MEDQLQFLETDEAKVLRCKECHCYRAWSDGTCMSFFACMRAYSLAKDETAERKVVGDTTKHCECVHCGQSVDPWDSYCRGCGRRFI